MRHFIFVACIVGCCAWACSRSNAQRNADSVSPPSLKEIAGTPYGDYVIGDPVSLGNLSIFPISSKTPKNLDRYTTLDEGLAAGTVKVIEMGAEQDNARNAAANPVGNQSRQSRAQTPPPRQPANQPPTVNAAHSDDLFGSNEVDGDVNKLMVQNKSGKPLYLMPGEVISGGKQDRTIGQEIVIAASDKAVPIDVFCVEHGRWAGRSVTTTTSQLGSTEFNRNQSLVVSQTASVDDLAKEAKSGKFVASVGQLNKDSRRAVQETGAQGKVWEEVAKTNSKSGNNSDSGNFAANYLSGDIAKDFEPFIKELRPIGETKQIVGVAVAVNGKMLSVDIFESAPLFKKFWPKLLKSYALDAVAAKSENKKGRTSKAVAINDCIVFLKKVENSKAETLVLADGQKVIKRDSPGGISFSYYNAKAASADGGPQKDSAQGYGGGGFGGSVHTSVLSK